jgi:hypothetical protein
MDKPKRGPKKPVAPKSDVRELDDKAYMTLRLSLRLQNAIRQYAIDTEGSAGKVRRFNPSEVVERELTAIFRKRGLL